MATLDTVYLGNKAIADKARPLILNNLLLARYGNDAERTEGARWIQKEGRIVVLALCKDGYINAIWAVYTYIPDYFNSYFATLKEYATMHDREGNLTMDEIKSDSSSSTITGLSHSGRSSSTSTGSGHSGSGSSSSTSTGSGHSGSGSGRSSSTSTGSSHSGSSSGSSSSTSTGSSHSGSSSSTCYGQNPYLPTQYTRLDPNAGQWDFTFNNGETISTADYDQALLIEATIYKIGKGPRPGAQSWTISDGGTYYNYADAWEAFTQRFGQEMGYTNETRNELFNEQYNEEAFNVANQNSTPNDITINTNEEAFNVANQNITPSDITINTNKDAKKSNLMWWLLGGSVVVLGIGLFISRKDKKNKR